MNKWHILLDAARSLDPIDLAAAERAFEFSDGDADQAVRELLRSVKPQRHAEKRKPRIQRVA